MKDNKILVQPFTNKRNNQISLTILKRNTSDKLLEMIGNKDVKFLEFKLIKRINKKDIKN